MKSIETITILLISKVLSLLRATQIKSECLEGNGLGLPELLEAFGGHGGGCIPSNRPMNTGQICSAVRVRH